MRKKITFPVLFAMLFSMSSFTQTIWDGPIMTFTKENNADWTLEENQDRITDNVWITRATSEGIFNIVTETEYTDFSSPADTEWAFGTTADIAGLTFESWEGTVEMPPSSVDQDMVLHLITDDIYIDVKFTSWTGGNGNGGSGGGGFSYERTTAPVSSTTGVNLEAIQLRPNPASDFIYFDNVINGGEVIIYDLLGKKVVDTQLSEENSIAVDNLANGVYFVKIDGYALTKFSKI